MAESFAERYRSLALTSCEWRAFGVADPEKITDRAFQIMRHKSEDLRTLYKAIEKAVDEAYRHATNSRSVLRHLQGQLSLDRLERKADFDELAADAFRQLRHREVTLLRDVYWDDLTPAEIVEIRGGETNALPLAVERALENLNAKVLQKTGQPLEDPAVFVRGLKPGTHRRSN